ncbi:MAG TPA: CoA pyrophosphatase [Allosphingosinicella sp.]|uniref:CoA pyrophosphatase n=1 Tax=Allosphingosinicella sp. TaxID=2823234 RepID=UPI002F2A6BB8
MTLADTLREALALGAKRSPVLLSGDPLDPLAQPDQPVIPAAVLVPVVDRLEPTVILTLRTNEVRRHPGQISFPGGRIDQGDAGPVEAALREAEEEIGLPRACVELVGTADPYQTITGYEVIPVVGVVAPDIPLTPQPSEVAAIFEVPLHYMLDGRHQQVRTVEWRGAERSYYEIQWQEHRIWGATAAMIVNLSRRLQLAP